TTTQNLNIATTIHPEPRKSIIVPANTLKEPLTPRESMNLTYYKNKYENLRNKNRANSTTNKIAIYHVKQHEGLKIKSKA
ncbi:hypothetical protein, partial [Salmonella enterica]|uniref:hypothetical protein n=1 Tax=Salmonella enterica TaxID=28901 RepID=UPI003075B7B7